MSTRLTFAPGTIDPSTHPLTSDLASIVGQLEQVIGVLVFASEAFPEVEDKVDNQTPRQRMMAGLEGTIFTLTAIAEIMRDYESGPA